MNCYNNFILFSSGLGVLMTVSLLLHPLIYRNTIFSILLIIITYLNLFLHLGYINSSWNLFVFAFLKIPVSMLLGPVLYIYIMSLTEEKLTLNKKDWKHFLPTIIFTLIFIPNLYINPSTIYQIKNMHIIFYTQNRLFLDYIVIVSACYIMIYIFLSIKSIIGSINRENPIHSRILLFLIVLCFALLTTTSTIAAIFIRSELLFQFSRILTGIIIIGLFLINQRHPYLLMHAAVGINTKKKSKTYLSKVDLQQLNKQLQIIMEKEKFYCDEDITLKKLSDALEVTPHQLSEFLNDYQNKNFNSFINTYRIKEAKNLLLTQPNRNAMSIAFASGFNSYSTFHFSFKKETGISPADYRREKLKNN